LPKIDGYTVHTGHTIFRFYAMSKLIGLLT